MMKKHNYVNYIKKSYVNLKNKKNYVNQMIQKQLWQISAAAISALILAGCGVSGTAPIGAAEIDLNADTIEIASEAELKAVAQELAKGNDFGGKVICLNQSIELLDESDYLPLGKEGTAFAGIFNGKGNSISGVELRKADNAGLFDALAGTVCNLCIEDGTIEGKNAGGIASSIKEGGAVLNCVVLAEVSGENAGGIAADCDGRLVNCLVFPYFYKDVEQRKDCPEGIALGMTADDKRCDTIENCYTGFGRLYEIMGFGSDQMIDDSFNRACTNLNDRINELTEECGELEFNKWVNADRWLVLSDTAAKKPAAIKVKTADGAELAAEYNFSEHAYVAVGADGLSECVIVSDEGEENHYAVPEGADCCVMVFDGMKVTVKGEKQAEAVAYYNENDELTDVLARKYITAPGEYKFSGDMNAQIVIDGKMDGDVKLLLENANIHNLYDPAVIIEGKNKKSNVIIELADNSENFISGSEYIDIFGKNNKHEGAVSSDRNVIITGDTGVLTINAVLEGIEGEKDVAIEGGSLNIVSIDDAVAADGTCVVNGGKHLIDAGDDAFDCEQIVVNDGILSISAPSEHDFNGELLAQGGYIASGCSVGGSCSKDSVQGKMRIMLPSDNKEGVLVITDKDDKPIMGYEYDASMDRASFSFPDMIGGEYQLYLAENVKGKQLGRMYTDIEAMDVIKKLSNDDGDVFTMDEAKYIIDGLR